ncbi:hypothetical protein Acr_10g0000900 [Actinidia rufa]|uniref:Transmembrane protein n=1 Tax=Actinidia rufa TaxID=165716 RepID=A0A7J0F7M4_9ERIC|nr:hypothetical protein Acr_10g0000900 [Actinidia rufa]
MARRPSCFSLRFPFLSSLLLPLGTTTLWHLLAVLSIFSLLLLHISLSAAADSHFEGFDDESPDDESLSITSLPPPPTLTQSLHPSPPSQSPPDQSPSSDLGQKPSSATFEYWDEDEFEGLPVEKPSETEKEKSVDSDPNSNPDPESKTNEEPKIQSVSRSYIVEILCGWFLVMFVINFFTGKRENENIALAWATKFAGKDSIFEKNFSLLGIGDGKDDSPLLLKEGQNVFRFYASGRRYCQGLLATMELQSRHDLISRLFNLVVPCKDEITFEVYMNDEAMDHVVFALAKKKAAKTMQKEVRDLQRFAGLVSPPSGRKWAVEDLAVVSESKEVAGDLVTEVVLEQVLICCE